MTPAPGLPAVHVEAVHRIVDDGMHNAFTDLARFRGRFYLTFRSCPDGHMIFPTSRIRVLCSDDGVGGWREVCSFAVEGRDVRDPHFLELGGRLFVYSGTWLCDPEDAGRYDMNDHLGYGACTADGESWEGPRMLEGTYGHYIWRAAAHDGRAFLCGRRRRGFVPGQAESRPELIESALLCSDDGWVWHTAGYFARGHGDETAFLVEADGSILALVRGADPVPARLCRLRPPYQEPELVDLERNVGGPLLARWGDRLLVAGRRRVSPERAATCLSWLIEDRARGTAALHDVAELPSGGDTSYPGFVDLGEGRGLLSYYSSHEGSGGGSAPSHVYLAGLRRD